MRKAIIAGNWKLNNGVKSTRDFLGSIKDKLNNSSVDVVICPTFTSLATAVEMLRDTNVKVGAQNMHWQTSGAYTGEVSAEMLVELGVDYVIIGHSERRQYFNETDESVNLKLRKALEIGLKPIVCVGESLEEREKGQQEQIVTKQVKVAFSNVSSEEAKGVIVAYEPIWAIGTGKTATSKQADQVCGWIRDTIKDLYSSETAQELRIQYGGSVKPDNIEELMSMENIDGALVGGASLKLDFEKLVKFNS